MEELDDTTTQLDTDLEIGKKDGIRAEASSDCQPEACVTLNNGPCTKVPLDHRAYCQHVWIFECSSHSIFRQMG